MTTEASTPTGLALLRVPFPPHQISKLPKPYKKDSPQGTCEVCGGYHGLPAMHLDYVGHAALTDRLLDADPAWSWEPMAIDQYGQPAIDSNGGMWIKLTVCGVTRLGYGDAQGKTGGNAMKERIGDALRNAAMRFGAALDLWHKGDLHVDEGDDPEVRRGAWLEDQFVAIDAAANVGELKRIVDAALAKTRANNDADAERQILAARDAKAAKAKRNKTELEKEAA